MQTVRQRDDAHRVGPETKKSARLPRSSGGDGCSLEEGDVVDQGVEGRVAR